MMGGGLHPPTPGKVRGSKAGARTGRVPVLLARRGVVSPHLAGQGRPRRSHIPEHPTGRAGGCAPPGCARSWCHRCPPQPRVPVGAAARGGRCHCRRWHGQAGTATRGWQGCVSRAATQGLWHSVAGAEPSWVAATGPRQTSHPHHRVGLGALRGPGGSWCNPPGVGTHPSRGCDGLGGFMHTELGARVCLAREGLNW